MFITVFTPTYNRGYIIENLYRSLQHQSFHDFEWIVIDDGSSDNTSELFSKWIEEDNFFNIIYEKVQNGGKHRAINKGVKIASGELFYIVDSDDWLPINALKRISEVESTIPLSEKKNFAGVCGKKAFFNGEDVGHTFSGYFLDITSLERPNYNINGDKAEVFYTDLLKKYPFPEFDGEYFITECVVWNQIAFDGYKLRFFNDVVYKCDYLPDGLSSQAKNLFNNNPKGEGVYIYQRGIFGITRGVGKWIEILKYYSKNKSRITFKEMAEIFHLSQIELKVKLLGMKLLYQFYMLLGPSVKRTVRKLYNRL